MQPRGGKIELKVETHDSDVELRVDVLELEVDFERGLLLHGGNKLPGEVGEFELLRLFIDDRGEVREFPVYTRVGLV